MRPTSMGWATDFNYSSVALPCLKRSNNMPWAIILSCQYTVDRGNLSTDDALVIPVVQTISQQWKTLLLFHLSDQANYSIVIHSLFSFHTAAIQNEENNDTVKVISNLSYSNATITCYLRYHTAGYAVTSIQVHYNQSPPSLMHGKFRVCHVPGGC